MGYISFVLTAGVAVHVIMPGAEFIQTSALRACYLRFRCFQSEIMTCYV